MPELKLATPGKTSVIIEGYQVCPKVTDVFGHAKVAVAWRSLIKPILPLPAEVLFNSVFPKKSASMFPLAFAPQTSGPLNLIPTLEVIAKKLLPPAALMSFPFASNFSSSG